MFVDEKAAGEKPPVKVGTLKLSEAIRIGCPKIKDSQGWSGCALGTGYFGATGRDLSNDAPVCGEHLPSGLYIGSGTVHAARHFGVPLEIAAKVSTMHFQRNLSREQCADWLESQGY